MLQLPKNVIYWFIFVEFAYCALIEKSDSQTNSNFSENKLLYFNRSLIYKAENLSESHAASCSCENGNCFLRGKVKVCECFPEYRKEKYTNKCVACNCGKESNCTVESGKWFWSEDIITCICKKGYQVVNKVCIGPCTNNPCKNDGTCVDIPGDYQCNCSSGYYGRNCENIGSTRYPLITEGTSRSPSTSLTNPTLSTDSNHRQTRSTSDTHGTGSTSYTSKTGSTRYPYWTGSTSYTRKTGSTRYPYWTGSTSYTRGTGSTKSPLWTDPTSYSPWTDSSRNIPWTDSTTYTRRTGSTSYIRATTSSYTTSSHGTGSTSYTHRTGSTRYPPWTGSTSYTPGTGSTKYPPSTESTSFSPWTDSTISHSTEILISSTPSEKICDCGKHSSGCQWNNLGKKICTCFPGYAQIGSICSDCYCGRKGFSCNFDVNENKICTCEKGYAQRNQTCSAVCRNDDDCLNKGICQYKEHGDFCNCKKPFTGDFCEINTVCESLSKTCKAIGAECIYLDWLDKGICECPSTKKYNRKLKFCEDICQPNTCTFGDCVVIDYNYVCKCYSGYEGTHCEKQKPNINGDLLILSLLTVTISLLILGFVVFLIFRRSKDTRINVKKQDKIIVSKK